MWYESLAHGIEQLYSGNSAGSVLVRIASILVATLLVIYLFDKAIEIATPRVSLRADTITTSDNVLRLRRIETFVSLGLTVVRVLVIAAAFVFAWRLTDHGSGPVALIGVGTVAIILASATVVPLLRDVTYGFIMMAERWYNVGDHVVVEPFPGTGGVVERVSLRSTKLRSVNGEAIWIHHQHVQGMRVTSAASHPLALEVFVNNPKLGRTVIEDAIKIIPSSPTTIPQPLAISEIKQVDDKIWRITAICEVTPFREWIIEKFAIKVIMKTDELTGKPPTIIHGPIVYYADATAEKRYRRSATVRQKVRSIARRT
jgi:hypothetical protein